MLLLAIDKYLATFDRREGRFAGFRMHAQVTRRDIRVVTGDLAIAGPANDHRLRIYRQAFAHIRSGHADQKERD